MAQKFKVVDIDETSGSAPPKGRARGALNQPLRLSLKIFECKMEAVLKRELQAVEDCIMGRLETLLFNQQQRPVSQERGDDHPRPIIRKTAQCQNRNSLSYNEKDLQRSAWKKKIVVEHKNSNTNVTEEEFMCLNVGRWLNDTVMNLYTTLLKEREEREPEKYLKCHFFNTFFYVKLQSDGYNGVQSWTSSKKLNYTLFSCSKIFVPIHKVNHWCLAVINNVHKKFEYLDPMGGDDQEVLNILAKYYVTEVKCKSDKKIDLDGWAFLCVKDHPKQRNGYDCSMFVLKYIDYYSRNIDLSFTQENMNYFRKKIANEILQLKVD